MGAGPSSFTSGAQLTSSILGGAAGVASGIAALTGTTAVTALGLGVATAPATLGISAAIAGLVAVFSSLFHGADPRQVGSSQIEQAIEAAADNLYALAKNGMIYVAEAVVGMETLLAQGQQNEQSWGGQAGSRGYTNLTNVINAEIAAVKLLSDNVTQEIDLQKAQAWYVQKGPAGTWYDVSIDAANQLTDSFLQALPARSLAGMVKSTAATVVQGSSTLFQQIGNLLGEPLAAAPVAAAGQPASALSPALAISGLALGFLLLRRFLL